MCYFIVSLQHFGSKTRTELNFYMIFLSARRPPVEETTSFLNSLLASHGPNYLEKLFGTKARHRLGQLGGVDNVAIALSGNNDSVLLVTSSKIIMAKHECRSKTGSINHDNDEIIVCHLALENGEPFE